MLLTVLTCLLLKQGGLIPQQQHNYLRFDRRSMLPCCTVSHKDDSSPMLLHPVLTQITVRSGYYRLLIFRVVRFVRIQTHSHELAGYFV